MDGTAILARLREHLGDRVLATHDYRGDHTALSAREGLASALAFCRDEPALGFDLLMDVSAVDYLRFPGREDGPRFELVYHLYSVAHNHRVRLKVPLEQDDLVVPTASGLWPIANWRARDVGHVRDPLRRTSGPPPAPALRGVRGAPAAQGLSGQPSPAAHQAESVG